MIFPWFCNLHDIIYPFLLDCLFILIEHILNFRPLNFPRNYLQPSITRAILSLTLIFPSLFFPNLTIGYIFMLLLLTICGRPGNLIKLFLNPTIIIISEMMLYSPIQQFPTIKWLFQWIINIDLIIKIFKFQLSLTLGILFLRLIFSDVVA